MEKPGEGNEEESPNFKNDPEAGRRMIEEAFAEDEGQRERIMQVFYRALGDLSLFCMEHEDMCDHHVVDLRDSVLSRAGALAYRIAAGVKLYRDVREYGLQEPVDIIDKIYDDWEELALLFNCREPQDRIHISTRELPEDGPEVQ